HSWGMPPVMFSVVTKYHKGRHSLFLYNSEIFYAFTQDILRSHFLLALNKIKNRNQFLENLVPVFVCIKSIHKDPYIH
ncbi:hypothetical protein GBO90_08800, partial [Pediococcus acidilactici]